MFGGGGGAHFSVFHVPGCEKNNFLHNRQGPILYESGKEVPNHICVGKDTRQIYNTILYNHTQRNMVVELSVGMMSIIDLA